MNTYRCEKCGHYWQAEGEDYPSCHCPDDGFLAPCEEEEYEESYDNYEECGFDPYEGCYTYDC